jgi:serine/threonine protein kinase
MAEFNPALFPALDMVLKGVHVGAELSVQKQDHLGKGGFGHVYKVVVKNCSLEKQEVAAAAMKRAVESAPAALGTSERLKPFQRPAATAQCHAALPGALRLSEGQVLALKVPIAWSEAKVKGRYKDEKQYLEKMEKSMFHEGKLLAECSGSDYVLACLGWGEVKLPNGTVGPGLLVEYSPIGSVQQWMQTKHQSRLSYEDARAVLYDVTQGILRMHSEGIIHGDLKPNNVLCFQLPDGTMRFKVVDLGGAQRADRIYGLGRVRAVTLAFMAPEQIDGKQQGSWVDIWQLGALLMALRSGENPFQHCGEDEARDYVPLAQRGQYKVLLKDDEQYFLAQSVVTNVADRRTAMELLGTEYLKGTPT